MTIKDLNLNDIGRKLLLVFIFIVPIFWAAKINAGFASLRLVQEQVFQLGAMVIYAVVLLENIYLAAFLILSVALYLIHDLCGGNYLVNILYGCLLYQVSYRTIDSKNVVQVFKVVLWLAFVNLVWMILQNLGVDLIFFDLSRPGEVMNNVGFMGLKCFMGMLFVLILPFAIYFNIWVALLLLIPIGLSESSISIISAAIILIAHFWWKFRTKSRVIFIALMLFFSTIAVLYTLNDSKANMMTDRFNLWKLTLKDALKEPFTGWGMDSFRNIGANGKKDFLYFKNEQNVVFHGIYIPETGKFKLPKDQDFKGNIVHPWDSPHNEYIQILFEFGIFGLVLLLLIGVDIAKRFSSSDAKQRAIVLFLISFAVCSLAQFPAHVARLGVFLPVMLGIYYKLTDEIQKGELLYGS